MGTQYTQENRPYVLWRRVSTKQQGDSGLGLDAQQTIAEYFMHGEPVKVFTDVYSGTKLGECPDLARAIKYCKENGYLLVIAKTDRFRNVQEALAILDEMGEGNLCFCDLPTTDRTVLTIVFAIWERQAIMGRVNTKKALAERKKQRETNGYWISKSGNVCTHLGSAKGCDMSKAAEASCKLRMQKARAWRDSSPAWQWVKLQIIKGKGTREILEEFEELSKHQPDVYCSRNKRPMTLSKLSQWKRKILEEIRIESMCM